MPDSSDILKMAQKLLASAKFNHQFSNCKLTNIEHVTGDASYRMYYRLFFESAPVASAIMIVLASSTGPIVAGNTGTNQSDTYVELAKFLESNGVAVPKLYIDCREDELLLVEDVGPVGLWSKVFIRDSTNSDEWFEVEKLFKQSIDQMLILRSIKSDYNSVAFQRYLGEEQYFLESQRFITFFLPEYDLDQDSIQNVTLEIRRLAQELANQPKVLSHRDFMAWNIQVDSSKKIRILDFQDALLAAPCYDLISLLCDRDTHMALGEKSVVNLSRYFRKAVPNEFKNESEFERCFYTALLQRNLRLAGQFINLSNTRGNPIYKGWVPGILNCIGRSLEVLDYPKLAKAVQKIPEISAGIELGRFK